MRQCMLSFVRPHLHVYASMHAFLCQASSARVCVYACFPLSSHGVQAFDRAARRIKSSAACVGVICLHHQLHFQLKRQHCGVHDCGVHCVVHGSTVVCMTGVHCAVQCAVHGSTVVCMTVVRTVLCMTVVCMTVVCTVLCMAALWCA